VYRCAIQLEAAGVNDHVVNVIHVKTTTLSLADISASIQDRWPTAFRQFIPTQYAWNQLTITPLNGSASVNFPWTGNQPSSTQASLPMNVACVESWRTGIAGRSHRGRSYIGPIGNNFTDPSIPDRISSTPLAAIDGNAASLITSLASDDCTLVVASYTLSTADEVTNNVTNPKICTVRKRVNGR
jgi:hypothetical protein